ncbi:isochorismatase hydrolase [Thozetella sp. PMI_491]|nr:isochorismatase hydrolase [Thozetella sp. PMI_491]
MHTIAIPQSVIDRVTARRGKEHIFDDLDPSRTALVVVDLQNAFMRQDVAHAYIEMARSVVPNVNRLAAAVRATGGVVVWIQTVWTEENQPEWTVMDDLSMPQWRLKRRAALSRGSKGWELWSELDVQPEDLKVEKLRFSAFIQGSSDLDAVLRGRGMDTLLIAGAATNVCCESTARDGMMLNYKTIMISDGNATGSDEEHNASLTAFYSFFGDVMPTDLAISYLEANSKRGE